VSITTELGRIGHQPPIAAAYDRRIARRARDARLKYYILVAPALLLSLSVVLVPAVLTAVAAFTDWNGVAASARWIGLDNFSSIFADGVFWTALANNIRWMVLFLTIPVAIGLGAAMLLLRRPRSRTGYQLIFLIPYVLAAITNALVWLNIMYSPIAGLVGFLRKQGINAPAPLANLQTALYAVAAVDMWHFWGFLTVVYLASLRQTPVDHIEAAHIEGASGMQLFRYVYFPSIRPTLQLMFVMITIFSFLSYDYVKLLTGGGPAHSTEVLSTYAYTFAFSTFQFGKAAAVGLIMSLFGLLPAILYTWLSRRDLQA
jgi:raffinose/stachyose/melibiose transport system permease protein